MTNHKSKRGSVISLTIFFLILLSTGLSGYYVWQGFLHGFDKYLPILCSTLLLDGLGIFALIFKVSFESRRRAMVPFVCSLLLIVVCSIHLAALANMRTGVLSQDEADTRAKSLDDDRHSRNVKDADALVEKNCAQCKPERKRRMYQSEMARLEQAQASMNRTMESIGGERSWGRRYVEDYATAVQLVFGLLCGLAMLVNNFVRMYAEDPAPEAETWPSEIEVKRSSTRRADFAIAPAKNARRSSSVLGQDGAKEKTQGDQNTGLEALRAALSDISFYHPGISFKADLKPDFPREPDHVRIRAMLANQGTQETIHSIRIRLDVLNDATTMERSAFTKRLRNFLNQSGFEL
jgi:hypothetical protein